MEYKKIKKELEKLGYLSFIRKAEKEEEYLFSGIPDTGTLMKPNYSFNIFIQNDLLRIDYFEGQLLRAETFSNLEELVAFIKVYFPIVEE